MVVEHQTYQQPGIVSLIKQLIGDIGDLLSQHLELFRQEIKEDVEIAAKYTSIAIAGALVAFTSLIFFGFSLIFILDLFLPICIASLIVTAIFFIIAATAIIMAKNHLQKITDVPTLNETRKTVEEAQKWFQELK
ncbi:MAG: phage holin family protein [Candidatus Gastranaerophilales bacterium]|nr:phage holin family protein [Candidatus Gastranaerophilales bacterium]